MKLTNRYDQISVLELKSMTLIAALTAVSVIGRIMLASVPNVQPVTTIVILVTLLMGVRYGLIHATFVIFISNFILGFGIWMIGQLFAYAIIVFITFLIRRIFNKLPFIIMVIYCAFTGFIYGFIQALFQAPVYGVSYFYGYYLSGLIFDFYHALSNALFYLVLAPILLPLLDRLLVQYSKNKI